jgi:hypothetical protein
MGYVLVKQTLPCAEKNCKSKMTLTENTDNLLYYNCIKKHDEHTFRYNITQKRWKKIIIKTKLILHYNENPCEEHLTEASNHDNESNEINDQVQPTANTSNLTETNGKSQKRNKKVELAEIKAVSE